MSLNLVSQPVPAGKLTTPWLPRRVLRSWTLTPLLALVLALTALPAAARAEAPCPNQQLRVENHSTSLPDCRAYEMVTPSQKNGALIDEFFFGGLFPQVATDGQRVIAESVGCFGNPESCRVERSTEGEPYEFSRTAGGWVTHPLAPPTSFETDTAWTLSADAATALFSVPRVPPGVIEEDFYGRDEHGAFVPVGPVGEHTHHNYNRIENVVSTRDLSHVVYRAALESGPIWSFDPSETRPLYEYTVGTGNAAPLMVAVSGGFESHQLISECGTSLGGFSSVSKESGALSEDGRTVYFAVEGHGKSDENCTAVTRSPPARELYARIDGELPDARSVLISGPTPAACTTEECEKSTTEEAAARDADFEAASADGSRVFFTDTQQLTNAASEDPEPEQTASAGCQALLNESARTGGCNLYESECAGGNRCAQPAERRLIDISEGAKEHGGPRVQGVVGISADGSHVYFVARGVLTGAEENESHERAQDGKANLYAYAEGHVAFIATLAPSDRGQWEPGIELKHGGVANVTPAGRFLLFTSHRALTADATCVEGEKNAPVCPVQVFEYDAVARALLRVSIGEQGFNDNGNQGVLGRELPSGSHAGDASVAEPSRGAGSVPLRLDPTMSDDGAFVFFQSPVALAPGALNDVPVGEGSPEDEQFAQNVYEYHEGHVSLISDGKDTTPVSAISRVSPVELLGSDASGSNVFFTTFDPLVPQDTDTTRDIYDARIEGGVPAPVSSPSCEGEACQGAPAAPPAFGAPSSSTFSGPGNVVTPPPSGGQGSHPTKTAAQIRAAKLARALKACHAKKNKRKRASCEKQARKLYGPAAKAKRATR